MTNFINNFTHGEYKYKYNTNLKIDAGLYNDDIDSSITYCQPEISLIKINSDCRIDTGNNGYKLFDTASYSLIYRIMKSSKQNLLKNFSNSCKLFNTIFPDNYFKKINTNDIFLYHLVIAILDLKTCNSYPISDLKNIAKELLNKNIKVIQKNGVVASCCGLRCQYYKYDCKHKSIKNPFYLLHTKQCDRKKIIPIELVHTVNKNDKKNRTTKQIFSIRFHTL